MANRSGSSRPAKGASQRQRSTGRSQAKAPNPKGRNARRAAAASEPSGLLDDKSKRIIIGVVLCVVAVALFVAAAASQPGVATELVSGFLHLALGVGAYILPIMILLIGISFFTAPVESSTSVRAAIGLALIFVALLGLLSLFAPGASAGSTEHLFEPAVLSSLGGYVGSGIAWAGVSLFGQAISCIVLIGVVIVGVVVTGFSVRGLVEKLMGADEEREDEDGVLAPPPGPRIRRAQQQSFDDVPLDDAEADTAVTRALPVERRTRKSHADAEPEASRTRSLGRARTPEPAVSTSVLDDIPTRSITRKLGSRSRAQEAPAAEAAAPAAKKASSRTKTPVAAPHPQDGFVLPSMSLLATTKGEGRAAAKDSELAETAADLQETLEDFGIMASVVGWVAGPTVTLFKVDLPAGVRVSRVTALNDDIALALAAPGVRIFAPIPGTNYVGIEVPNRQRQTVLLGDVLKDAPDGPLQIAIGKDVEGHSIVSDLAKMPHLLIGGTTGSGKSVSINAMIMSILMRATPAEVRFIMIDPKRVEFTPYNGIPHLYVPVVTEPKEAASALSWGVAEMERRLKVFSKVGARNIGQYNAKCQANAAAVEGTDEPPAEPSEELPYIVIIIDELADLMMNVGKEVEFSISRIAQLARAAGIHLIVATQRPSTNVVTGLIKANITNRIAFNVASGIDSRVILDTPGAENLIGLGDLLLSKPELAKPQRIQGCYVSEDEINAVVDVLKEQGEPDYHGEILKTNLITVGSQDVMGSGGSSSDDPLLWEAADIVVSSGFGSTSNIQRRLKVGYSRAGRIMDMLEEKGVVGPANGSKPREVLVDAMELETLKAFEQHDESAG